MTSSREHEAEGLLPPGGSHWASDRTFMEVLTEDMQIRYDGVLQCEGEIDELKYRDRVVRCEYMHLVLSTCIYPVVAFVSSTLTVSSSFSVVPLLSVLTFEAPFLVIRTLVFVQAWLKRNDTFKAREYNQIGGFWDQIDQPIGFLYGQFLKDIAVAFGVCGAAVDTYTNVVSVMIIAEVFTLMETHRDSKTKLYMILIAMITLVCINAIPRCLAIVGIPSIMAQPGPLQNSCLLKLFGADFVPPKDFAAAGYSQAAAGYNQEILQNRNQVLSRMFVLGDNMFIPLLFPPDVLSLTADQVKADLRAKLGQCIINILLNSIPQAWCQLAFASIMQGLKSDGSSGYVMIYASVALSTCQGLINIILSCRAYANYKQVGAKLFINKFLKLSDKPRKNILASEITQEEFKTMAEYYMGHPARIGEINIEKGKIAGGYSKDIKIVVPPNVDSGHQFKIRINFTPGYVTFASEDDQQTIVDFVSAFPKVTLDPGFAITFPKDLRAKLEAMSHVTITEGGF
ncbi:unnamed protein product [Polarella glacialis]|uniref:Uncharacterized protein n=1 Tax=Polarella glacialis TaxID=89957 RepID=A0A813G636_POLGL|nr:unnamed protein product [Polarella glacialis]CAE8742808.1 unnamed protein product [Polarella glacialis]|mmetsp:Transcript_16253/g.25973  ORF Transcript_16253/g.25973 Transcript_16253/m.25973 type:complete len:513 (-) Transcript_16253:186-1724(-)